MVVVGTSLKEILLILTPFRFVYSKCWFLLRTCGTKMMKPSNTKEERLRWGRKLWLFHGLSTKLHPFFYPWDGQEMVHCAQCFTAIHDNILCVIYALVSYSDTLIIRIVVKHLLCSKFKIQDVDEIRFMDCWKIVVRLLAWCGDSSEILSLLVSRV